VKDAPGKYAEFVQHITKGGNHENLLIDANAFTTYFQSSGENIESVLSRLGVTPEDYAIAMQNGGDLVVNTGAYAEHIAGTEHFPSMYEATRLYQGGPTIGEQHVVFNNEKALEEHRAAIDALPKVDPEREAVRDLIAGQLQQASRVLTEKQALEIADGYAKVLSVLAGRRRAGAKPMSVGQLYEKEKLSIVRDFHAKMSNLKGADYALTDPTQARPVVGSAPEAVQAPDAGGDPASVPAGTDGGPAQAVQGAEGSVRSAAVGARRQVALPRAMSWHGTPVKGIGALKATGVGRGNRNGMGPGLHISAGPDVMVPYAEGNPDGMWRVGVRSGFQPFDASLESRYSPAEAAEFGVTITTEMSGAELWAHIATELGSPDDAADYLATYGFDGLYYNFGGEDAWSVWDDSMLVGSKPTTAEQAQEDYARQGSRRDPVTGELKVAQSGVKRLLHSTTLRSGSETLKAYGLTPGKSYTRRQVAAALEARQLKKFGGIALDDRSPEAARKIGSWMVKEILFELQNPEMSAIGWYTTKFQAALDILSTKFPELANDKPSRDVMTALIAITSDGAKVKDNFKMAAELYANYRKTGEFTKATGHNRDTSGNIALLSKLLKEKGPGALRSELLKEATVSELKKMAEAQGLPFKSDYQVHIKLPMAALVFGPKLGAFYANLMGAEGYLTMDRWWSRTFNRYRGSILPSPTAKGLARIKGLMGNPDMSDEEAIAATPDLMKSYKAKNWKNGTELEVAANTIWKAAFNDLRDIPENAKDRTFMLDTVASAQKQLKSKGVEMSIADIQAVLWYYEQRLYGEMGSRDSDNISYEEAASLVVGADTTRFNQSVQTGEETFAARITMESMPGGNVRSGIFPNIGSATPEQLASYHTAKMQIVRDALRLAGVPVLTSDTGHGYWDSESNPVTAFLIQLSKNSDTDVITQAAQIAADVMNDQDAVGWNRPVEGAPEVEHNAVQFDLSRPITSAEMVDLGIALDAAGLAVFMDASDPSTLRVIGYDHTPSSESTAQLHSNIQAFVMRSLPGDVDYEVGTYKAESGLVERSPNAQAQTNEAAASGTSGLQQRAVNRGRAQVEQLNARVADEFGWGERGSAGSGGRGGVYPQFQERSGGAHPVSAIGVHYGNVSGLQALDPAKYGTGSAGAEGQRLRRLDSSDPLRQRVYFYEAETEDTLPASEAVVRGSEPYGAQFSNLYDLNADPEGVLRENRGDGNAIERAVIAAGYDGYVSAVAGIPGRAIVLLGTKPVPVMEVNKGANVLDSRGGVVRLHQGADPQFKPVDTTSPQFKAWFGDSKATWDDGVPRVFYHGTSAEFDSFTSKGEATGNAIFFSTDPGPDGAGGYSNAGDGKIIPAYLKIEKPFNFRDESAMADFANYLGLDQERIKWWQGDPEAEAYHAALTGKWDYIESPEFQSFLSAKGYDSFYVIENGTTNIGVKSPTQIKSATSNTGEFSPSDPRILYSKSNKSKPLGYIEFAKGRDGQPRQFNLGLLEAENKSTVFHELGHYYLELLGDLAEDPESSDDVREDYSKILNWLGVSDRSQITEAMHERFADGHLAYLEEGKAPSEDLRSSFQKFSSWLSKIGKQLFSSTQNMGVDVNINEEVRGVFDRIYATEQEIESAKQDITPMFTTAEQAGMSRAEFAVYSKAIESEVIRAKEQLVQKLMAELKREQEQEWRDKYNEALDRNAAEIAQRPEYKALAALANGTLEDGETAIKLNRQTIIDKYGKDKLKELTRDGGGYVYSKDGNMDADTAAGMLGFESGDKLIEALTNLEPRKQAIERMARAEMEAEYPTLLADEDALREQAMVALNGEERERILSTELKALRNRERMSREVSEFAVNEAVGQLTAEQRQAAADRKKAHAAANKVGREQRKGASITQKISELRETAKRYIGSQPIFKLNPQSFLDNQRRLGREALKAAVANDYKAAAELKEKEILNHHLYLEAVKAKNFSEKFRTWTQKNDRPAVRSKLAKAGGTFLSQFDALRDRFSIDRLPNKKLAANQTIASWVESQRNQASDPAVAEWLLDESVAGNYRELSVTQLTDVYNALKSIKHLAYKELGEIIDGKRIEYEEMMVEFEDQFARALPGAKPMDRASSIGSNTATAKAANNLQGLDAVMVKVELLINWIDGNDVKGPAHRYIWNRIVKAQADDLKLTMEINKPIVEAIEALPKELRDALHTDTIEVQGWTGSPLSRAEVITMLLYSGQASRYEKLLGGYAKFGLNETNLMAAFSKLRPEEIAMVTTIWDTFEKLNPQIKELERRLSGVKPEWEGNREVTITDANGQVMVTLKGGYFPLVADRYLNTEISRVQEGGTVQEVLAGNGYSRASTSTSHTKMLTKKVYPLSLDFERTITSELTNQIKDLTHREVVLSLNKILSNPRFANLVKEHLGPGYYEQMMPWLVNIASDRNAGATAGLSAANKLFMAARANTVAAVLGFKFSSVIVQLADVVRVLGPGDYGVSPKHFSSAMLKLMSDHKNTVEMIKQLSPEMAERAHNLDRDLRAEMDRLTDGSYYSKFKRAAFSGFGVMDAVVSWPAWLGSYQQSMAEHGDSDRAAKEADRTVRMKLMTGAPKDLTTIQASKNPFYKAITMFMGDATANYNALRNAGHNIDGIKGIPTFTGALLAVMFANILGDLLKGQWPDKDKEAEWALRKAALAPLGTMPVVRDIANSADNVLAGKPFTDYKFSPFLTAVQKTTVDPLIHTVRFVKGKEHGDEYLGHLLESGGYALGVPGTAQATSSIKYLDRYSKGQEKPDNPVEFSYDLLTGKKKDKKGGR
jgi:hypothetical protein